MFKIMKVETSYTQDIDSPSYEADMLDPSNYQPHILYLSKIDARYWWHSERRAALAFTTLREATAIVAAYRAHSGDRHSRIQVIETGEKKAMPMTEDDLPEEEWTGRPQDDPRYVAAAKAAREAYLAAHPPVDCWIDSVQTIDLYLEGRHRARVFPRKAWADIFDENGNTTATVTYLRSETAFGAVEGHLRVGRIAEVRDDSNEGGGEISRFLRKQAEKDAANFRSACPPPDEASHYLQEAIRASKSFGGEEIPAARKWRDMIGNALDAIAANDRAAAHGIVLTALSGMDEDALLDWQMAWVDCARAAEALRRDLEKAGGESRG